MGCLPDSSNIILLVKKDIAKKTFKLMTNNQMILSYNVASGGKITPCNKIDRPLLVYRFSGNVMTSITTLRP